MGLSCYPSRPAEIRAAAKALDYVGASALSADQLNYVVAKILEAHGAPTDTVVTVGDLAFRVDIDAIEQSASEAIRLGARRMAVR
nr:hypothetical protein GCM10025732_48170 [Glycomyces mayteni]